MKPNTAKPKSSASSFKPDVIVEFSYREVPESVFIGRVLLRTSERTDLLTLLLYDPKAIEMTFHYDGVSYLDISPDDDGLMPICKVVPATGDQIESFLATEKAVLDAEKRAAARHLRSVRHSHLSYISDLEGMVTPQQRRRIFKRDGGACLRCGARENLTVDHIHPRCEGGYSVDENLQTLCRSCNSRKSNNLTVPCKVCGKLVEGFAICNDCDRAK